MIRRLFTLLTFLVCGAATAATDTGYPEPKVPVVPSSGTYYNPSQQGRGWQIEMLPNGTVYAGVYAYDLQGRATWYVFNGPYVASTGDQWADTGIIGRARSMLYRTSGGSCIGCPNQPATTVPATELGEVELVWFDSRRVEFRFSGGTTVLTRLGDLVGQNQPVEMVKGLWRVTRVSYRNVSPCITCWETGDFKETFAGYVEIVERQANNRLKFYYPDLVGQGVAVDGMPVGVPYRLDPGFPLPNGERQYDVLCRTPGGSGTSDFCPFGQTAATSPTGNGEGIYFDSANGVLRTFGYCGSTSPDFTSLGCGRESAQGREGVMRGSNGFFFQDNNRIVIRPRRGHLAAGFDFNASQPLAGEFILTRVTLTPDDLTK